MNAGPVPLLLIAAALGLALSFTSWRFAVISACLFAVATLVAILVPPPAGLQDWPYGGLLVSTLLTAALVYLPVALPAPAAIAVAINDGVWTGLVASISSQREAVALALSLSLLFLPGQWIVRHGYSIGIKVVCSWLIAIAALAIFVSLVPTPGYKPDHME